MNKSCLYALMMFVVVFVSGVDLVWGVPEVSTLDTYRDLVQEELRQWNDLYQQWEVLRASGDAEQKALHKMRMFEYMRSMLEHKRSQFDARRKESTMVYEQYKKGKQQNKATRAHEYMRVYEQAIVRISHTIAVYSIRIDQLKKEAFVPETEVVTSHEDLIAQKEQICEQLEVFCVKKRTLESIGASPNEISMLKSDIDRLTTAYYDIGKALGEDVGTTQKEYQDLLKKIALLADTESARRKENTDTYEYRYLERMETDQLEYKRINEKEEIPYYRANADVPIKYDRRMKAKKPNTHLPGEPR